LNSLIPLQILCDFQFFSRRRTIGDPQQSYLNFRKKS
jgi:hypothetical protein